MARSGPECLVANSYIRRGGWPAQQTPRAARPGRPRPSGENGPEAGTEVDRWPSGATIQTREVESERTRAESQLKEGFR